MLKRHKSWWMAKNDREYSSNCLKSWKQELPTRSRVATKNYKKNTKTFIILSPTYRFLSPLLSLVRCPAKLKFKTHNRLYSGCPTADNILNRCNSCKKRIKSARSFSKNVEAIYLIYYSRFDYQLIALSIIFIIYLNIQSIK